MEIYHINIYFSEQDDNLIKSRMTDLLLILRKFIVKIFSMSAICLFKVSKKALYDFVELTMKFIRGSGSRNHRKGRALQ